MVNGLLLGFLLYLSAPLVLAVEPLVKIDSPGLLPISSFTAQSFFTERNGPRTGGCQAEVFSLPQRQLIVVIAGGSDFLYQTSEGPRSLSRVSRRYKPHPEVEFAHSNADGSSFRGVLSAKNDGMRCPAENSCTKYSAHLIVGLLPPIAELVAVFNQDVEVVERCVQSGIDDRPKRVFYTPNLLERVMGFFRHR